MSVFRFPSLFLPLVVRLACLAGTPLMAGMPLMAAEPPRPMPWGDPQGMFEQIFGEEGEIDEKVLAGVEVSVKEEQQIGKRAVDAYLAYLKRERQQVVTRGKEVEYLRKLVEKLQPMMNNRERYPR
ncbi:MAG: hypothetical protein V3R99_01450, partial [Thermoguttaceae bacterium]